MTPMMLHCSGQTVGRDVAVLVTEMFGPELLFLGMFVDAGMFHLEEQRLDLDAAESEDILILEFVARSQAVQLLNRDVKFSRNDWIGQLNRRRRRSEHEEE